MTKHKQKEKKCVSELDGRRGGGVQPLHGVHDGPSIPQDGLNRMERGRKVRNLLDQFNSNPPSIFSSTPPPPAYHYKPKAFSIFPFSRCARQEQLWGVDILPPPPYCIMHLLCTTTYTLITYWPLDETLYHWHQTWPVAATLLFAQPIRPHMIVSQLQIA